VLRDVLGFRAPETAAVLGCTVDAANTCSGEPGPRFAGHLPSGGRDQAPMPGTAREQRITARFADAFERGDVAAIVALLTDDAWLTMPPLPFEYQGRDMIGQFLYAVSFRHGTSAVPAHPHPGERPARLRPLPARPARPGRPRARLIVLTLAEDRIRAITGFTDNSVLTRFGLPRTLPE